MQGAEDRLAEIVDRASVTLVRTRTSVFRRKIDNTTLCPVMAVFRNIDSSHDQQAREALGFPRSPVTTSDFHVYQLIGKGL